MIAAPPVSEINALVARALAEDLGLAGDLTTASLIPPGQQGSVALVSRQDGILCGLPYAIAAWQTLDPEIAVLAGLPDGSAITAGAVIARLSGRLHALLAGERVALNLVMHLSGIASLTAACVARTKGTRARICDTRKTLPGLRSAQKYAVRCGGGVNHRFGLFDAILIKDNHIAAVGEIGEAIARARRAAGHMVRIEVEIDSIEQIEPALAAGADILLLDNFRGEMLGEALRLIDGRAVTEASGGVAPEEIGDIARAGIDLISIGRLTHSAPALDIGLDWMG